MTPETLIALQKSIAHWERLASGNRLEGESVTATECALCELFNTNESSCDGCPVKEATGKPLCMESPYVAACHTKSDASEGLDSVSFRHAAMKELEFLVELLPQEAKWKVSEALEESIEHWRRLTLGTAAAGEGVSEEDCALCHIFHPCYAGEGVENDSQCEGCPVQAHTGRDYCCGTPHQDVCLIRDGMKSPEFREAALKMLMFLEDLVV
jgi:hypothetical protein